MSTLERQGFVVGLFRELQEQYNAYAALTRERFELEARLEVRERSLKATRDHLKAVMDTSEGDPPDEWDGVLCKVRFVGVRLADACIELLKEHSSMTLEELVKALNDGHFRFRTSSPLREVNAALMRQHQAQRKDNHWVYKAPQAKPGKRKVVNIA